MSAMTSDQQVRVEILSICEGRVSEAKQAYYWVMGEQGAKQQSGMQIGEAAAQARREQKMMQEEAARKIANAFESYPLR